MQEMIDLDEIENFIRKNKRKILNAWEKLAKDKDKNNLPSPFEAIAYVGKKQNIEIIYDDFIMNEWDAMERYVLGEILQKIKNIRQPYYNEYYNDDY